MMALAPEYKRCGAKTLCHRIVFLKIVVAANYDKIWQIPTVNQLTESAKYGIL